MVVVLVSHMSARIYPLSPPLTLSVCRSTLATFPPSLTGKCNMTSDTLRRSLSLWLTLSIIFNLSRRWLYWKLDSLSLVLLLSLGQIKLRDVRCRARALAFWSLRSESEMSCFPSIQFLSQVEAVFVDDRSFVLLCIIIVWCSIKNHYKVLFHIFSSWVNKVHSISFSN